MTSDLAVSRKHLFSTQHSRQSLVIERGGCPEWET